MKLRKIEIMKIFGEGKNKEDLKFFSSDLTET